MVSFSPNQPLPAAALDAAFDATLQKSGGDASATVAQATGTSLARSLSDRFADQINVLDCGAVGDGFTDDTSALVAAIAAAGSSRAVLITRPLFIARPSSIILPLNSQIRFIGAGALVTAFGSLQSLEVLGGGGPYTAIPSVALSGNATAGAPVMGILPGQPTLASAGTGYVPGDILTIPGGTGTAATFKVVSTQVVSATVAAGGTGGTTGTQTVRGTTGTGVFFQASVTVAGGAITAVNSITLGGIYRTNPGTLSAEPVVGANLTGATLSVVMGIAINSHSNPIGYFTNFGAYTALPSATVSPTGGSGTGATFATVGFFLASLPVTAAGSYATGTPPTVTISGGGAGSAAHVFARGQTPTLNGSVVAGDSQIFAGYGRISGNLQVPRINARWFGLDGTGTTPSTAGFQNACAAIGRLGGEVHIPGPATYLIDDASFVKSNTKVTFGGGVTMVASTTFYNAPSVLLSFPFSYYTKSMFVNQNYNVPFDQVNKVDQNISFVGPMTFDFTAYQASGQGGGHGIFCRMAENIVVSDMIGNGGTFSGTAFLACNDTKVIRPHGRTIGGPFTDHWEGPVRAAVIDADVFGTGAYGVLFTAGDTSESYGDADGCRIEGGRFGGFTGAGVWFQCTGGANTNNNGRVQKGAYFDCSSASNPIGIYVTGNSTGHKLVDFTVANANNHAVTTNLEAHISPLDLEVDNFNIVGHRSTGTAIVFGLGLQSNSATPITGQGRLGTGQITYAPGVTPATYSVSFQGNGVGAVSPTAQVPAGASGTIQFAGMTPVPVVFTGGTIDNAVIGGTTPNAATVTSLNVGNGVLVESPQITLNCASSTLGNRHVTFQTAGSRRWDFLVNATAEAGSNAGSNLSLNAYADDGVTLINSPLTITRSSGQIGIGLGGLSVVGNAPFQRSAATVAAAGTTLATATVLAATYHDVTSGTGGVALPVHGPGFDCYVFNRSGASITVYPDSASHTIEGASVGVGVTLTNGASAQFVQISSTNWLQK